MKKICLRLTLLFLCCSVSAVNARVSSIPLNKLAPHNSVDLRCVVSSFTLSVPIPERWEVKKADLSLPYVNSSNLLADRAQIVVKANDYPVGQVKLSPLFPEGKISVSIPPNMFQAGYNKLSFHVAQHSTKECEHPCSPDLWTTLNLEDGLLQIEYNIKPVPLSLSDMADFVFDPKTFPQGEVNIITEDVSSDMLTLAGITASGVAKRFIYRKVVFTTSKEIKPGYDNILIGRKEFVEAFLQQKGLENKKISGPYLRIAHLPAKKGDAANETQPRVFTTAKVNLIVRASPSTAGAVVGQLKKGDTAEIIDRTAANDWWQIAVPDNPDKPGWIAAEFTDTKTIKDVETKKDVADPSHALLIVSGLNSDHIKIAAETLASMTFPYPGADEMTVLEFSLPEISTYSGKGVLTSDKTYRFKTLDFNTHTFEGLQPVPVDISFRLPADFLIKQNQYVKLSLNFSYGAGMRPDSVLNILLNGKQVKAVSLNSLAGDTLTGYKIELPTYLFKPGSNTIKFSPILTPLAKECELIQLESLFLTLFENSTLYFPPMGHFVELPRIDLFMLNGFPFTRWPDGYETLIYIPKPEDDTIDAALNLIGLITQKNGYPLFGVKVVVDEPRNYDGEIILLGDIKSVPELFRKNAPLKLITESTVPYPVMGNWEGEESLAVTKQISELGSDNGVVMEFQSPYKNGRTVLLLTAASTKDLLALSHALLEPGVQALSKGDIVMVKLTPPDYKVHTLTAGKKYFTGKMGKASMLSTYLSAYPFIYYIGVSLLIFFLSFTVYFLLRRHIKWRNEGGTEEESAIGSALRKEGDKNRFLSILGFILKKIRKDKRPDR